MNSLKIPEAGLLLGVEDSEPKTQQAFTLDLSDDIIEGMIRCHQDGGDIQLALGANPTFHYGTQSHRIPSPSPSTSTEDELPQDLYLTQPFKTLREATHVPVMSFWKNNLHGIKPQVPRRRIETVVTTKSSSGSNTNDKKGLLKKPAANSNKLSRDGLKSGPRALSASPALKPIASPALKPAASPSYSNANGIAADQTKLDKLDRVSIIHELAIKPQTTDHLRGKWQKEPEDFKKALERVADEESGKWVLRARFWQELDPWTYDYDSTDREAVLSSMQKRLDKSRVSTCDPLWEKLVPKHERGQGKGGNLSQVQKRINEGAAAAAPKIAVSRAEDSSNSSKDNDDASSDKSRGGESMARTNSSKGKKTTASEAQAKRLLSKNKSNSKVSSAPKASSNPKTSSTPKTSPSKTKAAQTNGKKVLSAEIIENSDSSGDEAPAPTHITKPTPKPAKPIEKPKTKEKGPLPKTKPAAATVPKQAPQPVAKPAPKRSLPEDDDDDSSSSSGIPLSKRIKANKPVATSQQRKSRPELKQPPRDYSRYNHKNTSPTKSSPLASSPPTNASDMSSSNDDRLAASSKKRKAVDDGRGQAAKRQLSEQLIERAQRFKKQYTKYEALHYEVTRMTHPPQNKLDDLLQMHEALKKMKKRIYDEQQSLGRI